MQDQGQDTVASEVNKSNRIDLKSKNIYDETRDAFIPAKKYASWTLNESTCSWEAPVSRPNDEYEIIDGLNTIIGRYEWNESTTSWDKIEV